MREFRDLPLASGGGMEHYIPILIFTLVAISFPIITLIIAKVVRAGSVDPVKGEAYECGVKAPTYAFDTRFSIRYYLIAVLFVVFDVETIFLFPWAVIFDKLALFGFIEMLVFLAILLVGYVYAWRRGALEWA
jgi:NADH-quinone oxidoreductase subunit A